MFKPKFTITNSSLSRNDLDDDSECFFELILNFTMQFFS